MLLYRIGPEGFYAATEPEGRVRILHSDPLETPPSDWQYGRPVDLEAVPLLAPVVLGKIVGIGRNWIEHARELGNEPPSEPVLFLKAPSSLIGPKAPIVLPPESSRVEHEGEIALVMGQVLRRANREQARAAILGVTCACDVTARDSNAAIRRSPAPSRSIPFALSGPPSWCGRTSTTWR